MQQEFIIILIASIVTAILLTAIITRLVMLKNNEPKVNALAANEALNQLRNEHASALSKMEMLQGNYDEANRLANLRLEEVKDLNSSFATVLQQAENFQEYIEKLTEQLTVYKGKWEHNSKELIEKTNMLSRLKAEQEAQQQRFHQQEQNLLSMEIKMAQTFELLAGQTLDAKTSAFKQTQAAEFGHLLAPLKEELKGLKEKLEMAHNHASAERNTLFGQVKEMMNQTKHLSDQADNLTSALKGQAKQQGDWGEWILESILEYSGLTKNREYFLQQNQKNEAGNNIRPDVVVKYPDNRFMIIDSKVSLVGYDRLVASKDLEEQQLLMAQLVRHIKNHIDDLSSKQYQQKQDALDFVVMFVPLEGAYISAMQFDPGLWKYAYDKRIFLLSPTNLVAALKLVHSMWQRDAVHKNAEDIAARAALMYDKLVGFIDVFERLGKNIEQAGAAFTDAKKKLTSGKGNLISQAEQMNILQKRQASGPQIPGKLLDEASFEDS